MFNIQELLQKQLIGDFTKMFKAGMEKPQLDKKENLETKTTDAKPAMKDKKIEKEIANMEETLFLLNTFQA